VWLQKTKQLFAEEVLNCLHVVIGGAFQFFDAQSGVNVELCDQCLQCCAQWHLCGECVGVPTCWIGVSCVLCVCVCVCVCVCEFVFME
jgi:hypothetical protein